jgi:hypothetical protein
MPQPTPDPRGQVLVLVAVGIAVLLGISGLAIDVGRVMAERRHLQTAADAAALAACQSLKDGAVADVGAAAMRARSVASVNMEGSPSGTVGVMADPPRWLDKPELLYERRPPSGQAFGGAEIDSPGRSGE